MGKYETNIKEIFYNYYRPEFHVLCAWHKEVRSISQYGSTVMYDIRN
jgi:hypothetical protein